jgi:Prophage antirepressor|nr:MAG TPA: hypothetical protein [Caudoviricetes sp.]
MNELNENNQLFIEAFNYKNLGTVRVQVDPSGRLWFCLTDVCDVLELSSPNKVVKRLFQQGISNICINTLGGPQNLTFVDEGNLYKAIMGSRKPEAQSFQEWICYEVIPSIRRTGQYTLNQEKPTIAGFLHTLVDTIFGVKNTVDEHTLLLEEHNIRFTKQDQILMEYNGRITEVEEAQKAVFETEYWSILGFANYYRLDPNTYNSAELGKKASKYCRENNIAIGYRPDQHYGRVNIYPYNVLVEVFNNTFSGN